MRNGAALLGSGFKPTNILVAAGSGTSGILSSAELYSGASWEYTTDIINPERNRLVSGSIRDTAYSIVGRNSNVFLNDVDSYYYGTWSSEINYPFAGEYPGCFTINDTLHGACGANYQFTPTGSTYAYNGFHWVAKQSTYVRTRHGSGSIGDIGYIFGGIYGYSAGQYRMTTESFDGETWTDEGSFPLPQRRFMHTFNHDNKIYSIGGWDHTSTQLDVDSFDGVSWVAETEVATGQGGQNNCNFNNSGYIVGGYDGVTQRNEVESYNSGTWTAEIPMNEGRSTPVVAAI